MTEHEPGSMYVRLAINEAQHYKRCAEMVAVIHSNMMDLLNGGYYTGCDLPWNVTDVAKWAAYLIGDTDEQPA